MNQRALLPEILSITSARAPATGVHEAALRERQELADSVSTTSSQGAVFRCVGSVGQSQLTAAPG